MSHRPGHGNFHLSLANPVQVLVPFNNWIKAKPRLVRFVAPAILFAILLTPSIWMLSTIPPLWRDVDAYIQLTYPPGPQTILQYGPLYFLLARIPLYVGYATDCLAHGVTLPSLAFLIHPTLTDSDVFALLLCQHIALCVAAFYLISVTTRLFSVRLILALVWALNPLFYAFAHCVGSETLSMIVVLLIGATGLRIVRHFRKVPLREWLLFAALLWLSILTRHINATLAAVLPLTFLFLALYRLILVKFAPSQLLRRWQRLRSRQALQKAIIAVALGIGCIVLANVFVRGLCYAVHAPYSSPIGPASLGRLKFLTRLSAEKRNQLLDEATRKTDSADVKKLISLLRDSFAEENPNWNGTLFKRKAQASLFSSDPNAGEKQLYDVLNRTAWAIFYPPDKLFLSGVAADFGRSQQITIPEVVGFLFVTTRYYFSHRDAMPQCGSLVTFRGKNADEIYAIFKNHSYFHHPRYLGYYAGLLLWVVSLCLFVAIARARGQKAANTSVYATALIAVGLLMMIANCFLTIFQPRYALPMWELTIVSMTILLGGMMNSLFSSPLHMHSLRREKQVKQSDRVLES